MYVFQCEEALDAIKTCAETGEGNLLHLSIEAARARATVGEITHAMEVVCCNSLFDINAGSKLLECFRL